MAAYEVTIRYVVDAVDDQDARVMAQHEFFARDFTEYVDNAEITLLDENDADEGGIPALEAERRRVYAEACREEEQGNFAQASKLYERADDLLAAASDWRNA